MSKILIVDDNFQLTRLMNLYLASTHQTSLVFNLQQAIQAINRKQFDLFIIDRVLPDGDGLDLLQILQDKNSLTPVLMISNKNQVEERVRGLRHGADDYLGKPFSMDEFLLKVEKMLSITKRVRQQKIQIGEMTIYEKEGKVFTGEQEVRLRKQEFTILLFLALHKNHVISRDLLIDNLWDESNQPSYNTVDVYIRRIRMMLGKSGECLHTIRGYGYIVRTHLEDKGLADRT